MAPGRRSGRAAAKRAAAALGMPSKEEASQVSRQALSALIELRETDSGCQ